MKKVFKLTSALIAVIMLVSLVWGTAVSAAGSTVIAVSSKSVQVGQSISVTVTVNGGEAMYAVEADFTYDPAVLRFDSGDAAAGGNGLVHIVGSSLGATKQSYTLNFTALAPGSCTVAAENVKYVADDEVAVSGASVPGITVTAAQTAVPDKANLASLTVSQGSLYPRFSAGTTSYSVTVGHNVESITVNASANDGASVVGTGNITLKEGTNKHTITVTAADGTKKTYTINIKRLSEDEDTDEDVPAVDVLAVTMNARQYHVLSALPEQLAAPSGFEASTATYNGETVAVYADSGREYVLYALKRDEDENIDFYTYDILRDEFLLLPYMTLNGKTYIFADTDENASAPDGYTETELNIGNTTVRAFQNVSQELTDFYVIYCFADGEYKFYNYDSAEQTVQRIPNFKLIETVDQEEDDDSSELGLIEYFKRISSTGKIVIFAMIAVVACIIAIVVLLILRAAKTPKYFYDDEGISFEPEDGFDNVNEVSSYTFGFGEQVQAQPDAATQNEGENRTEKEVTSAEE